MSDGHSIDSAKRSLLDLARRIVALAIGNTSEADEIEVTIQSGQTCITVSPSKRREIMEPSVAPKPSASPRSCRNYTMKELREAILSVLSGQLMSGVVIWRKIDANFTQMFGSRILNALMDEGLIDYDHARRGFYRPDAPPSPDAKTVPLDSFLKKDYFVYCIESKETRQIKIGIAKRPQKRLENLQCGTPEKLELLGVMPGNRKTEINIHERFAEFRIRGEWFRDCPEIRAFIAEEMQPPSI